MSAHLSYEPPRMSLAGTSILAERCAGLPWKVKEGQEVQEGPGRPCESECLAGDKPRLWAMSWGRPPGFTHPATLHQGACARNGCFFVGTRVSLDSSLLNGRQKPTLGSPFLQQTHPAHTSPPSSSPAQGWQSGGGDAIGDPEASNYRRRMAGWQEPWRALVCLPPHLFYAGKMEKPLV